MHLSVWGRGADIHRDESPRAGSGPGTKAGLTPPIVHNAVRVHPMLGILCDSLGSFLSPYTHIKMLAMGNLLFSHRSSTGLSLESDSTSNPVPTAVGALGAGSRDPLRGHQGLRLPFPKTPSQLGTGHTLGISDFCACRTPSHRHRCPTPSERTSTSTCTCTCPGFGRRTRVRG